MRFQAIPSACCPARDKRYEKSAIWIHITTDDQGRLQIFDLFYINKNKRHETFTGWLLLTTGYPIRDQALAKHSCLTNVA